MDLSSNTSNIMESSTASDSGQNMEIFKKFNEIFKCTICFIGLNEPHICPKCSKLYCFSCITRWITTNENNNCPNCKSTLRKDDLIKIRWIDEDDKMFQRPKNLNQNENGDCFLHGKELKLFCCSCSMPVCDDCVYGGSDHLSHNFKTMSSLQAIEIEKFDKEHSDVANRLKTIRSLEDRFDKNIKMIVSAKRERLQELKREFDQAVEDLEGQVTDKITAIKKAKADLEVERVEIEKSLEDFKKLSNSKNQLAVKSKYSETFQKLCANPMAKYDKIRVSTSFKKFNPAPSTVGEFLVEGFSALAQKTVVYSDIVKDDSGHKWRLKVIKEEDNVGVYLELKTGPAGKFQCTMELIHPFEAEIFQRKTAHYYRVNEDWGYAKFMTLQSIADYLKSSDDSLEFRFTVAPVADTDSIDL